MELDNPALIQAPGPTTSNNVPLILIHDGGGTCFNYYRLGLLSRPVYGISNPRFYFGGAWKGGLQEMAGVYVDLIRTLIPSGPIIIGGWSLGGLLSLQMAHMLAHDEFLVVKGIILIDSAFPHNLSDPFNLEHVGPHHRPSLESTICTPEIRASVLRSFRQSARMVDHWIPPCWAVPCLLSSPDKVRKENCLSRILASATATIPVPESLGLDTLSVAGAESSTLDSSVESFDSRVKTHMCSTKQANRAGCANPPPTVLLRATDSVPPSKPDDEWRVDVFRAEPLLGWVRYCSPLIHEVMDVEGHHFELFKPERVAQVTDRIRVACENLAAREFYGAFDVTGDGSRASTE